MLVGEPQQQVAVDRLGEAGVRDRGRKAEGGELFGRLQRFRKPRAERQDGDLAALANDTALADFERLALGRHLDADAFTARIAQRRRAIVDRDLRRHHVHQVRFVGGSHEDEVRQAAEVGEVEGACMGRAVGADEAGAVHRETNRQALDRHIVHDLVVGALQERRINGRERLEAFGGEPGGEGHPMLLGDADIEAAIGKLLGEKVEPGARRHRRGNGNDLVVLPRFLDEGFGVDFGVGRRGRFRLGLGTRCHVELDDAVIFVGRFFGRLVALALFRDDVNEERPVLGVPHVYKHRQEMIDVVAVDIEEPELVEQGTPGHETAGVFLDGDRALLQERRQQLGHLFDGMVHRAVGAPGDQTREIARERADRRRNRHVIVIEDDDQARVHGAGIVHGLISHTCGHRAVADDGDHVIGVAGEVASDRHAQPGGDRGGGVGRTERVVFTLGALGETGKPAPLP